MRCRRLVVVFVVFILALAGGVVFAVSGAGSVPDTANAVDNVTGMDDVETQAAANVSIAGNLQSADGERRVLVALSGPANGSDRSVSGLKSHARGTQADLVQFATATDGVTVENQFWIANVVAITVDTDRVPVRALAAVEGVKRIEPATTSKTAGAAASTSGTGGPTITAAGDTTTASTVTTYGVAQVNAPDVWDEMATTGEGAGVAVLDTGVDVDHPDLALCTGCWAEFDGDGEQVDSEPYDPNGHGTHVSGTVVGGDASGEYIGVAPGADLLHGKIFDDDGAGTTAQFLAGMEWAVEENADVISLSLAFDDQTLILNESIDNARMNGVAVVASIGNSGEGSSGVPGNYYNTIGVGATDQSRAVAGFSGGEVIDADAQWGAEPPESWPDKYAVPAVAAPGVGIKSAVPGGDYGTASGTSMAAPHVAGTLALMQSATDDQIGPETLTETLWETAVKPAGWDEPDDERDTRYGFGIVDTYAATVEITGGSAEPDLSVVDATLGESAIVEGESVAVTATVENTGTATGTFTAGLEVDGAVIATEGVTVPAGDTETVGFVPTFEDQGTYAVSVNGTGAGDLQVDRPAIFEVASVTVDPETVVEGESVAVSATVENVGDREGTFTAGLEVDGDTVETVDVTVASGDTEPVSFERTFGDAGEFAVAVSGTGTTTVTVQQSANLELSNVTVDREQVTVGEGITVTAAVTNVGDREGTFTADLSVDGTATASDTVTVPAGDTGTVVFERSFDESGEYALAVNGQGAGVVTVTLPAADLDASFSYTPSAPIAGGTVEIALTLEADEANLDGMAGGSHDFADIEIVDTNQAGSHFAWNLLSWVDPQREATVVWEATVPADATNETLGIRPQIITDRRESIGLEGTVEVTETQSAVAHYSQNGTVGTVAVLQAVQDWQREEGFFAGLDPVSANEAILDVIQAWQAQR